MMKWRSISILRTWKVNTLAFWFVILMAFMYTLLPREALSIIYIDINAPSFQSIKIAIPDFKNFSSQGDHPELSAALSGVVSNDLDLSGYFTPMEKGAFLEKDDPSADLGRIRFKNWSVIGAEYLLKGAYTSIGRRVEVEVKLYDVVREKQIIGKRFLGKIAKYRSIMHRVSNEIIKVLTGHKGMFLSRIAFVGTSTGHKEIYIADYDGHNVRQMTFDRSIALLPRWSPVSNSIIYTSYKDKEGGPKLYIMDISSGKISVKRLSARKGNNIGGSWSPDGQKVALTLSHKGNSDIFAIDLNGKIIDRFTDHYTLDVSPSYSPDGKKIAFVSKRSGPPQIFVRDLSQGKVERLIFDLKYLNSPAWSSLNRIAFTSMEDGRWDIYTINADGSNLRRLTENQGDNEDPCWSPDGRYLIFSSNRSGGYHLYMMNANGQIQRRIKFQKGKASPLSGEETSPSWSPF